MLNTVFELWRPDVLQVISQGFYLVTYSGLSPDRLRSLECQESYLLPRKCPNLGLKHLFKIVKSQISQFALNSCMREALGPGIVLNFTLSTSR